MVGKHIYVNLPTSELAKATEFYTSIGATPNPKFSSEDTTCFVFTEHINLMVMTHDRLRSFLPAGKELVTSRRATVVLLTITLDSKEEVDALVEKAVQAGGKTDTAASPQKDWMYGRSFEDPDGHVWELMYMTEPPTE